jgi:hypothetical protein
MTPARPHRRLTAWLAMTALWLTIVSPVVSQWLSPAWSMPSLGALCGAAHSLPDHGRSPAPDGHPLEKCGYCGLFSHCPTMAGAAWLPTLLPPVAALPHAVPTRLSWMRYALLATPARGPPRRLRA